MWLWLWQPLPFGPDQSRPVTTSYQSLLHYIYESATQLRVQRSPAGKRLDYSPNLHEPCRLVQISAVPHSLQPRPRSSTSDGSHSAAARLNTQPPRIIRPPQRTGNSTQISSADYPLAACWTQPVAVRAAREIYCTHYGPFQGHHPPTPAVPVLC
jgi:hypothetical protein